MNMQLIGVFVMLLGCAVIAIGSYLIGRQDERRNAEMREHLARVIGGRNA